VSVRARYAFGSLLGAGLALTATAWPAGPLPRLSGPALAGPTHLHLIVSGVPPFIVDVDAGTVRDVPGVVGSQRHPTLWVMPSGNGALAAVDQGCYPCRSGTIGFRIRADGSVRRIVRGRSVAPARTSPATWVLRSAVHGHCRLTLVPSSRPSVRAPCGFLARDTEAGLLAWTPGGETLVDTRTGRVRAKARRLEPLHGDLVLEETGEAVLEEQRLSLVDLAGGARRPLKWPSILAGLDEVAAQPHGTLVAVAFGDPAYPGPAQAQDVWILDTATGTFRHLPGFPAQVDLKFSSIAWTRDDRLVLLLQGGGRTVLAVWRPGTRTLPLRVLALPERSGGSDTFVPLVGP
jgi:hypothetical protein